MIFQLTNDLIFPHPSLAEEDGLLAIGGDLSKERLTLAYNNGIFPWFSEDSPICWYSPLLRCVVYPDQVYVSRSMKKIIGSNIFEIKLNTDFKQVIENCSKISRKGQPGTWITKEMISAYTELHLAGLAHSVEAWAGDEMAGGLYGISLNNIFCGESMFSKQKNASKAAFIWLCRNGGYRLIDCQMPNDHLMSLGAVMITQEQFLSELSTGK